MGAFLDKPKMEKENEIGCGNGLRFALCSMQGWRVEMEDAHTAVIGLPFGLKDWSFFAVYDGHAGSKVAKYCAKNLLEEITSNKEFKGSDKPGPGFHPTEDNVKMGLRTGFLNIDKKMRDILARDNDKSGSTAVGCIISPKHIFFANCGDSRAVLSRSGGVCFSTEDHKPSKQNEKNRIEKAGGTVMIQRVNGSLAVSRALGDYEYKSNFGMGSTEQLVSPEPDIKVIPRQADDEFIVLACDGVWDVMSNDEVCHFIRSRLELTDNLKEVCNMVVDTCLCKGSRDNMSIIIVTFENAPKVSDQALSKEAELDQLLEAKTKEIMDSFGERVGIDLVMHVMTTTEIEGLPPGGGIQAKKSTIEAIVNRLNSDQKQDEEASDDAW
ncbi:protein phosphatase 1B-like isoform X1 [Patiria miniata]|uniref:PPM-type phosphatase domain-containing protein n=1 Tax=Patiria miniata TaxID=46514 RepID=A0A914BJQ8_PATMI|nr:protein phosphatase 1B-like isoform X1 [Patiria miniata]XP_038076052.1 protein phosphatase 1B-like isoform X1 [Patiria miniata]